MVLMVGLLASHSRGGLLAFGAASLALIALLRRWRALLLPLVAALLVIGLLWVDVGATRKAFETRSLQSSRLALWGDAVRMFPRFPVFGAGFNAFGTSYTQYQTIERYEWYGEAHNEYLQALLDMGIVGAALVLALLLRLLRDALRAASATPLDAGVLGAIVACCVHNTVDFNWQIPANAATFAALAGVSMRRAAGLRDAPTLTGTGRLPRIDPRTP